MTTPTPTPPANSPEVPITEGEPEHTRRLQALQEAHRQGVVSYLTSGRDPATNERTYPVLYGGEVYILREAEVLVALYFMAASHGPAMADKLAYRRGLRHGGEV